MNKKEKQRIKQLPTAIRYSDNKMAIGEADIKKLVKQTLLVSNIEFFDANNAKKNIIFYLDASSKSIESIINKNNNRQTSYNLIIKYSNDKGETDTDSFPTAVIQNDNKTTYKGYNDILSLLERVLNIIIFNETLNFYVMDGCRHCIELKPYINELKEKNQDRVKINIIKYSGKRDGNMKEDNILNEEEKTYYYYRDFMTPVEKELINGFPGLIRNSDRRIGIGDYDIKSIARETFPIEGFTTNNSKDTIQFYMAEWCGYSKKLLPDIKEYKKQQNEVNVEIIYDKDIPSELNITSYPTAIRKSDNKRVSGGPNILNLMKETSERNNNQDAKQEVKLDDNTIIVFFAEWCPHSQNFKPQLTELMKSNSNVKLMDSNDITPDLQNYVNGFPSALKVSDKTVAVGAPEILEMINSADNKQEAKPDNKQTFIFVYSNNCKYSDMIMPKWSELKRYITNNKININLLEYESHEFNNIPNNYKSQITGFPTLFVNNDKKYEGYDEILNYLNTLSL
jgi:thiol-disulfide isomerase/thioredoxin